MKFMKFMKFMKNPNQQNPKIYYQIIFVLIVILLFLFGYKLSPYIFQQNFQKQSQYLFNTADDKTCLKNSGTCQQIISFYNQKTKQNQRLNIILDLPNPIIIGEKFIAKAKIKSDEPIKNIKLNFEGVEMDMGKNSFDLQKSANNAEEFSGEVIVPICVTGKMLWRVSAEIFFENQQKGKVNWLFES